MPVGALATVTNGVLTLRAVVASLDGTRSVEGKREGPSGQAEQIGGGLAEELLGRGAEVILDEIRATTGDAG